MKSRSKRCGGSPGIAARIALTIVLVTCSVASQIRPKPEGDITPEEYEVLSIYITKVFIDVKAEDRATRIVIADMTATDSEDDHLTDDSGRPALSEKLRNYLKEKAPALQQATLDAFDALGAHPAVLHRSFHLSVPYELVEAREIDAIFQHGGWWRDFYKKYPGAQGFLTVSRVGFHPDGKQALFYASNPCGGKCGTGSYVLMEKTGTGWKVAKEVVVWIS